METHLWTNYVFGPVYSRRLGTSLGINISPNERKFCNFNCIYCECGWNPNENNAVKAKFPTTQTIYELLEAKLKDVVANNINIDSITFSGNGESTLHPQFPEIIDIVVELRNKYAPQAKISVLSNATRLHKDSIVTALKKVDNPILKLDSAIHSTLIKINNPTFIADDYVKKTIQAMKQFNGNFIMQTLFLKTKDIDNTTETELNALINAMKETNPRQVMIYPIDRATPQKDIIKLNMDEMQQIGQIISQNGFNVSVSF